MKNILKLITAIGGCLLVGFLGTPFTSAAIPDWYSTLEKPFFAPPNWLFGPVWTILYILMGIAAYLIWKKDVKKPQNRTALKYFLAQLAANFAWSPIFFGLRAPELGLVTILILIALIALTIKTFYKISKLAAYLLVPYLLWVVFATLLNLAIVILN